MATTAIPVTVQEEKTISLPQRERPRHTLGVLKKKIYPFLESMCLTFLTTCSRRRVSSFHHLSIMRTGQGNEERYCKYHCLIDHPMEKFFILNYIILKPVEKRTIIFGDEINIKSNHVAISGGHLQKLVPTFALKSYSCPNNKPGASIKNIQFRLFMPIRAGVQRQHFECGIKVHDESPNREPEEWFLIIKGNKFQRKDIKKQQKYMNPYHLQTGMKKKKTISKPSNVEKQNQTQRITLQEFFPTG
ncbi:hypothetical protein ACH5RR_032474 [Cinchona calisaya]|uniref:Uncharacterized protein n=1 Tax=Cinchona calisaya TaxID=153742 RepID=A0ABD2YML5_9GENT